ncbi:MAG: YIP1 family protein [Candidatus Parcubacteria bacterium]|nr:YIP1 family protein [Candidatus Parcubacteria bacterium]
MQKFFIRIFIKIKKLVAKLPDYQYFYRLFWLNIGISFLTGLLGVFSYTGWNIMKNTYLQANLAWPPEFNHYNLIILRDVIQMIILSFMLYFIFLFVLGFLICKTAKLFKREITIYKTWNILAYADLIKNLIGLLTVIIFIPFDYASPYNLTAPFIFIVLSIFGLGMSWYIIIYGLKISLKKIEEIKK